MRRYLTPVTGCLRVWTATAANLRRTRLMTFSVPEVGKVDLGGWLDE